VVAVDCMVKRPYTVSQTLSRLRMVMNIARRIRKGEQKLNMYPELVVLNVVHFGDGPIAPDQRTGNILVCNIPYVQVRHKGLSHCAGRRHRETQSSEKNRAG